MWRSGPLNVGLTECPYINVVWYSAYNDPSKPPKVFGWPHGAQSMSLGCVCVYVPEAQRLIPAPLAGSRWAGEITYILCGLSPASRAG